MLFDIDTRKEINRIPHHAEYETWKNRLEQLDPKAFQKIVDELNSRVSGGKVHTSSWIPGSNWSGTAFQPIYDACQDQESAAKFFGLILWEVMRKRKGEAWSFGRYEKDGIPIEGLTYFRVPRLDTLC